MFSNWNTDDGGSSVLSGINGIMDEERGKIIRETGQNKARACLEVLAIIGENIGSYGSEPYMSVSICGPSNKRDWQQWKDHPCNLSAVKRRQLRK